MMLNPNGGFWIARSIYLAAKLGVADVFDDQPKTIAQLAVETNTEPRSLYRLMGALASVGIFTEVSNRGRKRTEEEYRSLLRSNGFELTRVVPTPSMLSIIEAVKHY